MLSLIQRSALIGLRGHPAISISPRMVSNKITDAYKAKVPQSDAGEATGYATKASFDQQMKSQRFRGADAETGEAPTARQRFCLVLTRVYRNSGEIPQYVTTGTMNRMYDRMRIVFISVGVACFFPLFYWSHYSNVQRVSRDREAGVVVHKMSNWRWW
ncbi:hypothetical protein V3C99_013469 [Haemonchus contortus]